MAIKKGSFTFEFMYDDTLTSDTEVLGMSIDEIMEEANMGSMIGFMTKPLEFVTVEPEEVKPTLLSWANDGTFFDDDED